MIWSAAWRMVRPFRAYHNGIALPANLRKIRKALDPAPLHPGYGKRNGEPKATPAWTTLIGITSRPEPPGRRNVRGAVQETIHPHKNYGIISHVLQKLLHPLNSLGIANRFAGATIGAVIANDERSFASKLDGPNRTRVTAVAHFQAFSRINHVHLTSSATQGICSRAEHFQSRLAKGCLAESDHDHSGV